MVQSPLSSCYDVYRWCSEQQRLSSGHDTKSSLELARPCGSPGPSNLTKRP